VPGWLIALEPGTPLLADDLVGRYHELETQVADLLVAATEPGRKLMESAIRKLSSWGFLLRQVTRREPLEDMCADVRRDIAESTAKLAGAKDQARLDRLTDALSSLRRLDALRFLHWTLKSWLIPHVVATSLMLALLVVHIFQVLYGIR